LGVYHDDDLYFRSPFAGLTMIPIETLIKMYTQQHLTVRQIGAVVGKSGVSVWKRLKKAGITAKDGEWVTVLCNCCGKSKVISRGDWRKYKKHYCNNDCRGLDLHSNQFLKSNKLARVLVNQYFELEPEYVIHSRTGLYDKKDLMVFASDKDYLDFCRGKKIDPLWDGSMSNDSDIPSV